MAFKMRSPLHNEPLKQGYGKVVEKTGATKQTLKPKDFSASKDIGAGGVRVLKSSKQSKTPTIDKYMKMNERPSVSSNEPSYLDKVKRKAGMVGDLAIKAMDPFGIGQKLAGSLVSPMLSPKSGPKSIIEGPSKRDTQEQKRRQEKADESAKARGELPAPGNMSPLHNEPVGVKFGVRGANLAADTKGKEQFFDVDDDGQNTTTKDNFTNSNTGAEENVSGEDKTMADKLIEENESGDGKSDAERELYEYNPAMYARRKARQDKRNIRRSQRESRIVGRQYGYEEGRKVDDAYTGPRSMDEASYENPDMRDKRVEQERKDKEMQEKMDQAEQKIDALINSGSPSPMTPNRAGRPKNSNILMTAPVIKTGKHSAKDAVAKLKMRNIAQSE